MANGVKWYRSEAGRVMRGAATGEVPASVWDTWRIVTAFIDQRGYPPTIGDISGAAYVSSTSVIRHLDWLAAAGILERWPHAARGIRLVVRHPDVLQPAGGES